MCQPKPGPRCAAHTRAAYVAARVGLDGARRAHDADTGEDSSTTEFNLRVAQLKFEGARDEYETTPQGQEMLRSAIDQMNDAGMPVEAGLAQHRLTEAIATRSQQMQDLVESRRYANGLAEAMEDRDVLKRLEVDAEVLRNLATVKGQAEQDVRRQRMLLLREPSAADALRTAERFSRASTERWKTCAKDVAVSRAALSHYGAGDAPRRVDWDTGLADGDVYRNPDGTYNLVTHRKASPGFPDGRLVPVVEVMDVSGDAETSTKAFLLADKQIEQAWDRDGNSHTPLLWVTEPGNLSEPVSSSQWDLVSRS